MADQADAADGRWFTDWVRAWSIAHPAPPRPLAPPEPSPEQRAAWAREAAASRARQRMLLATGVPRAWVFRLARGGFRTADQLADATDEALLRCRGIGLRTVAAIRACYPHRAWVRPEWLAEE